MSQFMLLLHESPRRFRGRREESVASYRRALELTPSEPVRRFLRQRIEGAPLPA